MHACILYIYIYMSEFIYVLGCRNLKLNHLKSPDFRVSSVWKAPKEAAARPAEELLQAVALGHQGAKTKSPLEAYQPRGLQ